MPCYRPLHGFRAKRPEPSGRYRVVFNLRDGYADLPIDVPCGQCIGCRLERSRQWAIRCMHEASLHEQNCFITLTIDDEHMPKDFSLNVELGQKFYKRLRKKCGPFRYLHAGEYGETTGRPHYHACLFGLDFPDKKLWSMKRGHALYTSEILDSCWQQGQALIGSLTFESAAYVARYVVKKVTGERADAYYSGKKPEFNVMSRRPGIGAKWLEKWKRDVYPSDEVISRGVAMRPPRAYDRRLELTDPDLFLQMKRTRRVNAVKRDDLQLAAAEANKAAQIQTLRRS